MRNVLVFLFLIFVSTNNDVLAHSCSSHAYLTHTDYIEEERNFADCDRHTLLKETTIYFYSNGTRRTQTYSTIFNKDGSILESGCSNVNHIIHNKKHYFHKKYKELGAVKITGKMSIEERNRSVESFKSQEAKLLFATPQSAKEGLTLTIANNAIFYDRGFNLDDYLQAQDRIHRISQKKDCNIYNLMVESSIDIWVDYLLKAKQQAAFLAQGDISIDNYTKNADYSFANIVHEILNS